MKREINVAATSTKTEYDKKGNLTSTIELRVPAEDLDYFQEVLQAQDDEQDVRCTLIVRNLQDGTPRKLAMTLKNSKMQNFVPVAIFTKYGVVTDNLTQLFDTGRYGGHELLLVVEVVEDRQQEKLDFEAEPVTPDWVIQELTLDALALERMVAEGCPQCPDAAVVGNANYAQVAGLVARADYENVCALLQDIGIDPTDWDDPRTSMEQDLVEMRRTLLEHWQEVAALSTSNTEAAD